MFTRPQNVQAEYSEIQFMSNDGSGTFTDVTESTLYGYDTEGHASYNPRFFDINDDGIDDYKVISATTVQIMYGVE